MKKKIFSFQFFDGILNIGIKPGDDIQKIQLIRQVNGLSLFFTFVAASVSVIFFFFKGPLPLVLIQIGSTFFYFYTLILNRQGKINSASKLIVYVFELHLFLVMLFTNAWNSAAISIIILYPLLAVMVEISVFKHVTIGLGQAALLYFMHKFFPAVENYFITAAGLSPLADEILNIMAATYTPIMAATIIGIIFKENLRAREKQKEMLNQITIANRQLEFYANALKDETQRLKTEINIARRIQTMVLPSYEEVKKINELDIACIMRPADEVGGDYYDIINLDNVVTIGIGDVIGHGLSSGIIMLMAQTAIRTLAELRITEPERFLSVLNNTLLANISRIKEERSMTLALITYENNRYSVSGQHESIIVCRKSGKLEIHNTSNMGFYIGMVNELPDNLKTQVLRLEKDDVMLLYTDGVTEAENEKQEQFGMDKVCRTLQKYHELPAEKIKNKFIRDLYNYIGEREIYDDISFVVIKQR